MTEKLKQEILYLIDKYWKFDEYLQPRSSWHDKHDLLKVVEELCDKKDSNIKKTKNKIELPKYVSLNGCELRLRNSEYWRDAGQWGVNYKIKNGKIFSSHYHQGNDHLHNIELIPISEENWRKGNDGYV